MPSADPVKTDAIMRLVQEYMDEAHLRSVIVRVSVDGEDLVRTAVGESMTGVPATVDMHFRNGAVAISYVSTLMLQLVDEQKMTLEDKVSEYLPDLPHADEVTIRQLAQMTSGYHDFVHREPGLREGRATSTCSRRGPPRNNSRSPSTSRSGTRPGRTGITPTPTTSSSALVLEEVTGMPLEQASQEKVLDPLGLDNTKASLTAEIPDPVLHAFTSERRGWFNIPADMSFYEESTYWNPSWTISHGAIQTSNIDDLHDSAIAVGTGELLSPESYEAMTTTDLRGTTTPVEGCASCVPLDEYQTYGLGLWITGDWYFQNPLFYGYAAVNAYLPSQRIAIAVAVTFEEEAFGASGDYSNSAEMLFRTIGAYLAPDDAPPTKPAPTDSSTSTTTGASSTTTGGTDTTTGASSTTTGASGTTTGASSTTTGASSTTTGGTDTTTE